MLIFFSGNSRPLETNDWLIDWVLWQCISCLLVWWLVCSWLWNSFYCLLVRLTFLMSFLLRTALDSRISGVQSWPENFFLSVERWLIELNWSSFTPRCPPPCLDVNANGFICAGELRDLFVEARMPLPGYKLRELLKKMDKNSDSKIDFEEFTAVGINHSTIWSHLLCSAWRSQFTILTVYMQNVVGLSQ